MNRMLCLLSVAGLAAAGILSVAPSSAHARPAPVEITQDSCGRTNVYINGKPVFVYTDECFPDPA